MDIAAMTKRIMIEHAVTKVDEYGNHVNSWEDYFSCFATVSGEGMAASKEAEVAGVVVEQADAKFTVRYCGKTARVKSTEFRIRLGVDLYDILSVDHCNYRNHSLKFVCKRVRR